MKQLFLSLILSAAMMGGYAQDKPKQCQGITVKNAQCKNRAVIGKDYCHIHDKDTPRCGVITSKGQPCKRHVKEKGQHCWQHQFS